MLRCDTVSSERVARSTKLLAATLLLTAPVYPDNAKTATHLGTGVGSAIPVLWGIDTAELSVRGEVLWYDVSLETGARPFDEDAVGPFGANSMFTTPQRVHLRAWNDAIELETLVDSRAARISDGWRF